MPTVGVFHRNFWKARANIPIPAGTTVTWMYPKVQSVVTMGSWFGALQPLYERLEWIWSVLPLLWRAQDRGAVVTWLHRVERLNQTQMAVLERVVNAMDSPHWSRAQAAVQDCATSPKFHQPEQWVEYGRALKANRGQAQNVFRHVKVVHALRTLTDGPAPISNPEAHLLAELAYQAFAAIGRPNRKVVSH